MFDLWGDSVATPLPGLELQNIEIPSSEKLSWEKELLGTYISEHPFTQASKQLSSEVDAFCSQITEEMAGQIVITAGIVASVRQSFTKDSRTFVSALLEDFGGSIEVTAWPNVYERTRDLWQEGNTLIIKGKVRATGERIQLNCQSASIYQPRESQPPDEKSTSPNIMTIQRRLRINLATSNNTNEDIARLTQLFNTLREYPGEDRVFISIASDDEITNLEAPHLATSYCAELHDQLIELVAEQDLFVDEVAN